VGPAGAPPLLGALATTFVLTLSNPMTILSFVAVFAGLGLVSAPDATGAGWLVLGVFLGSAAWWLLLSAGVAAFRRALPASALPWINRASGVIVMAFGAWAVAQALP
jgi:putative LysE/RhtB family amino acid efflux pump